ncbi:PDDEXK nuclease domain-containing protein [Adhaeribacter radiodurans]|uniref:PDDEXK nuclease domain-containing protein n=1 Tax=Adhaeribacter radiodurans TaxID=2745197 RepID=UPI001FE72260|nr:PDDEXK nuclease domain-containing protein [Adhaeribacter radiodurans]
MNLTFYTSLLEDVKSRIRIAQTKATLAANAEMIFLYWDIGQLIFQRQQEQGWSAAVIPKLSKDLKNELPELKGFSERNLGRMLAFYREYPPEIEQSVNLPQPVANLQIAKMQLEIVAQLPWGHNLLLIEKIKDMPTRMWYAQQTIQNGWSRDVLSLMLKSSLHTRQGNTINNFAEQLPDPQSDLARQSLKDPYIFDFLTLTQPFTERELEVELTRHIEKFLLELGTGFAFVGRQYHLTVSNHDYYLDLLFYHLHMRCFVVIDLKKGEFKPEYAGKMNFYCSAVDDLLRHATDGPTIGLILCQTKDKVMAEYALRDVKKPIGISEFELTRALPENLKSSLPTIEDIENELTHNK